MFSFAEHLLRILFFFSCFPFPTVPFLPETPPFLGPQNSSVSLRKRNFRGWGTARGLEGVSTQERRRNFLKNGVHKLDQVSLFSEFFFSQKHAMFRKSVVSIKFLPVILGPEMAAPILWAPGIFGLFLLENPHAHKIPPFRGGVLGFFRRGGVEVPILFLWVWGFFRNVKRKITPASLTKI